MAIAAAPSPARAQDAFASFVLVRVCLPYANRSQSFEGAIRAARDMEFRRPNGDNAPLEEWASEVNLISKDGAWRLRLEEGTVTRGDVDVYEVTCRLSSTRASARELADAAHAALRGSRQWAPAEQDGRWNRRTSDPDAYAVQVEVTETAGERPVLAATGSYY